MKITACLTALILLCTGVALAQEDQETIQITGEDELVKQKSKLWEEVWVHPDLNLAEYDNLYIWQTVFQFRDVSDEKQNRTTTAMMRGDQEHYTVSEESRAKFEEIVSDVVVEELNRSKQFEIVDVVGPRTMLVRALVLDIVSDVPSNVGRMADVHLSHMGEATFIFELVDAETGVIQARAGDRRYIQPPAMMNQVSRAPTTSATVQNFVEMWAKDQALTLRNALDKRAKKAKK